MSADPRFHQIITAVALGGDDSARQVGENLSEAEHGQLYIFGTAVMSICLERRFQADASAEAIRSFVNEMRQNYANSKRQFNYLAIEGLIRGFAGDEHLLDEISPSEQLNAQFPIIRKIVAEDPALQQNIDALMTEADQLVDVWHAEEA
jgi:hypothetical protein